MQSFSRLKLSSKQKGLTVKYVCATILKNVLQTMSKLKQKNKIKQAIINEITLSLQKIEYGEVVITVHNAKVVQIETREKKRFQD